MASKSQAIVHTTEDTTTKIVAPVEQVTTEATTAATKSSTGITAPTSMDGANPTKPPEGATITFTEQSAPFLRLPGEIRNRIYHELFQLGFEELQEKEKKKQKRRRWTKKCDPKDLRPLLYGLSSCQQIYQETKDILFRTYVVAKPDWCLRDTAGVSSFFARTISFCQAMEHYAPSSRFGVEASSGRFGRESTVFTPKHVKFFIDELERQTQRAARITLEVQTLRDDEAMQRRILFDADLYPCPVWKSAKWRCSGKCSPESPAICAGFWELEKSTFHARGSVGEYVFLYS